MLDVANLEGFNVRAWDFKNFEPSRKHHFESRRDCGQKRIIDSFLQAAFKAEYASKVGVNKDRVKDLLMAASQARSPPTQWSKG